MSDFAPASSSGATVDTSRNDVVASSRDLTEFAQLAGGPGELAQRMGIELIEASAQRVVATMPVAGNTQPLGLLHGGASAVLAETLGSIGASMHSIATVGGFAVGVELSVTHHRSARSGVVTAVATPLHLGGTIATYEIVITDSDGARICTARLTCMLRRG